MKHIWLEKENIYRAIGDFSFGSILGAVSFMCLMGGSIIFFVMFTVFTLALFFAGIVEFKNDIAYDSGKMNIRTVFYRYSIKFSDIIKIERVYIREGKNGHWRWYVVTSKERISVPFPDSLENEALNDLFECIKLAKPDVKWNVPANPVTYPR